MKIRQWLVVLSALLVVPAAFAQELLNASYDVSRELFDEINPAFVAEWQKKSGQALKIRQSHGGSSKQARAAATAYLEYLYSPAGQEIAAKHYNRVYDAAVLKKYATQFPTVKLVTVDQVFGGWDAVTKTHFADGGILDQALTKAPAR
jgi:ABC-type sulfate transport system substrate-binding protein